MCHVQDVPRYQLVNSTHNGMDYFLLEETSGILRLKRPLTSARPEYRVSGHTGGVEEGLEGDREKGNNVGMMGLDSKATGWL